MTAAPGPQQPDEVPCVDCGQPPSEHGWAGRLGCGLYRSPTPLERQHAVAERRLSRVPEVYR